MGCFEKLTALICSLQESVLHHHHHHRKTSSTGHGRPPPRFSKPTAPAPPTSIAPSDTPKCLKLCVASDGLWHWDVAVNDRPHKEARGGWSITIIIPEALGLERSVSTCAYARATSYVLRPHSTAVITRTILLFYHYNGTPMI